RVVTEAPFAVEFRYNALCYRDREFGPRRTGVRRVAVIGDSFTEGQGVKEGDVYPRVLERLLEQAEPGRWEVYNFGHRNADVPELSERFAEAVRFEPDVLIYGMVLNDADQAEWFRSRNWGVNNFILDQRRRQTWETSPELGLFDSRLLALGREA